MTRNGHAEGRDVTIVQFVMRQTAFHRYQIVIRFRNLFGSFFFTTEHFRDIIRTSISNTAKPVQVKIVGPAFLLLVRHPQLIIETNSMPLNRTGNAHRNSFHVLWLSDDTKDRNYNIYKPYILLYYVHVIVNACRKASYLSYTLR